MPVFSAPLDLRKNELRNAVTQNLSTAPLTPIPGLRYYDTVTNLEQFWNGTKWVALSDIIDASNITGLGDLALLDQVGPAEIADGAISDIHISPTAAIDLAKLAIDPLDRANHTGTQLANTISDFDAQVRTNPLNLLAPPTGPVDMANQAITNAPAPLLPTDLANKAYVDGVATGLDVKDAVQAASTGNVDIAAPGAAIDGVTLVTGDRVLLKDQTNAVENGIYVFNGDAVPMTRAPDSDTSGEVSNGMFCLVTGGGQASTGWVLITPNPVVLDASALDWAQFSAVGTTYVGTPDRILITGGQIDIDPNYSGQASLTTVGTISAGVWQGTPVDIAYGGTGATTAVQARLNLGTTGKFAGTFGDGSALSYTVTHGLNTYDVAVEIYETGTKQTVYADVLRPSANQVTIEGFRDAPLADALTVVVIG